MRIEPSLPAVGEPPPIGAPVEIVYELLCVWMAQTSWPVTLSQIRIIPSLPPEAILGIQGCH